MTDPAPTHGMLVAALAALAVGPLADRVTRGRAGARSILDGGLGGLIAGLVVLHVLPESYAVAGLGALVAALVGLLGPRLIEGATGRGGAAAVVLAVLGLGVHAMLDGAALGTPPLGPEAEKSALGFAVIVHRLPVGLLVWGLVSARGGPRLAGLALAATAIATVAGYGLGREAGWSPQSTPLALFQALVGGTLLHLVRDESPFAAAPAPGCCGGPSRGWAGPRGEALGFVLGLGLGVVLPGLHEHDLLDGGLGARFVDLILTSAPALVLGFALAGAVAAFLPAAPVVWATRGGRFAQAVKGVGFGLPLPICSCGVVPVYRSLIARGLPGPAALAFLVATPELGIESIALTVPLLGVEFTVARVASAALLALAAGVLVGGFVRRREPDGLGEATAAPPVPEGDWAPRSLGERLRAAARFGFIEVVDDVAAWLLFGLALAAALDPSELGPFLARIPILAHVPMAALLGVPLYVCASGATPIGAALIAAGLSPGAGLAFLLSGPASNVTTFGVLDRLHGRATALAFAAVMIGGATALGWGVDLVLGSASIGPGAVASESHGAIAWGSAVVLFGLFIGALFRRGPRKLAREIL